MATTRPRSLFNSCANLRECMCIYLLHSPPDATHASHCQLRVPCAPYSPNSVRPDRRSGDSPAIRLLWERNCGLEAYSLPRCQLSPPCRCCPSICRHWPVHREGDAAGRLSMEDMARAGFVVHPVLCPRTDHHPHCGAAQVQGQRRPCGAASRCPSRRGPRYRLAAQPSGRSYLCETA